MHGEASAGFGDPSGDGTLSRRGLGERAEGAGRGAIPIPPKDELSSFISGHVGRKVPMNTAVVVMNPAVMAGMIANHMG
ncbi:MAG TPA: hypothetical protein VNO21_01595 [Polyangiaceae bacterium]|nr:hypothetical protein [Polyangiaceae bacterium]